METGEWSELPHDIVRYVFERLSFVDFDRAKMVCSNWYSVSKQTVPRRSGSPWLMLFLDDSDGCVLYNPDENKVYKTETDISGSRFLASCGKWFLMLEDSESKLYIIDVLSGKRKNLPPLEQVVSNTYALKRVGVKDFKLELPDDSLFELFADEIKGRLWVDEKTEELSLVWYYDGPASFICFYKKGNDHYGFIPIGIEIPKFKTGLYGLVLRGYRVYISTNPFYIRVIDFSSGQQEELPGTEKCSIFSSARYTCHFSIAVRTSGEVLFVTTKPFKRSQRTFRVYKKDPKAEPNDYMPNLVGVDSLGDEALLFDLGITVPANYSLGFKPNCIYFTRLPRFEVDICVFNLATKTLEPFSAPSNMKLNDARWFFPLSIDLQMINVDFRALILLVSS